LDIKRGPTRRVHRLSPSEVEELILARRAGAEIRDLAARFGVHRSTVLEHLRRAEEPHRPWAGRTLDAEGLEEAAGLYQSGLSLRAVGERLGVDRRYLQRVFREAGVEIRPAGRQPAGGR